MRFRMRNSFAQTLRSLELDGGGRSAIGCLAALSLGGLWLAWLLSARVAFTMRSTEARLEVAHGAAPLIAAVAGRVGAVGARLGEEVEAGRCIVRLESGELAADLRLKQWQAASLGAELGNLAAQEAAGRRAAAAGQGVAAAAVEQARSRTQAAEAAARLAAAQERRQGLLHSQGLVSAAELERARAESEQHRAAAAEAEHAVDQALWEARAAASARQAAELALASRRAAVEREVAAAESAARRLGREIKLRSVRAPVRGVVAELAALRPGSVVGAGARLATIVPARGLVAVASLPPAALGRVHPGQAARLTLSGAAGPGGHLRARVAAVAGETVGGVVRVELAIENAGRPATLQHGMPCTVDIEIGRLGTMTLLRRAAGELADGADPARRRAAAP
jgi:adhesin transport system membrane fusion protein